LFASAWVSTQLPLQSVFPGPHLVGANDPDWHWPLRQACPDGHWLKQAPQLLGSVISESYVFAKALPVPAETTFVQPT
jgi:hypothetical protein